LYGILINLIYLNIAWLLKIELSKENGGIIWQVF
jgi:hypothetical protein